MNIVHPPYVTNSYWFNKIDPTKIEVPEWPKLEDLHPCDLQSSNLKGCIPSAETSEHFYSVDRRRLEAGEFQTFEFVCEASCLLTNMHAPCLGESAASIWP
eukprot:m.55709 g.55709  ORF g.55709 m.55709 type:complete len:101 (-) comp12550_c0_seq1:901-1203(-)